MKNVTVKETLIHAGIIPAWDSDLQGDISTDSHGQILFRDTFWQNLYFGMSKDSLWVHYKPTESSLITSESFYRDGKFDGNSVYFRKLVNALEGVRKEIFKG